MNHQQSHHSNPELRTLELSELTSNLHLYQTTAKSSGGSPRNSATVVSGCPMAGALYTTQPNTTLTTIHKQSSPPTTFVSSPSELPGSPVLRGLESTESPRQSVFGTHTDRVTASDISSTDTIPTTPTVARGPLHSMFPTPAPRPQNFHQPQHQTPVMLDPEEDGDEVVLPEELLQHNSFSNTSSLKKHTVSHVVMLWNPFGGNKHGGDIAKKAEKIFHEHSVKVTSIRLEERGHCEKLCQNMDLTGVDLLCVVGGDGTFHECINGLMKRCYEKQGLPNKTVQELVDEGDAMCYRQTPEYYPLTGGYCVPTPAAFPVPVSMLPAGTGNSFAVELGIGKNLKKNVLRMIRGLSMSIDIARLTCADTGNIYAFNSIHWGLASKVIVTAEKMRWMGDAMRYTTAAFWQLIHGTKRNARVVLEDANGKITVHDEKFALIVCNNITSASKGMKVAPLAKLDDGLWDILLVRSSKVGDLWSVYKAMKDGTTMLSDPETLEYKKVRRFGIAPYKAIVDKHHHTVDVEELEELVDVDGELKGNTPFECVVIPQAIRVIV